jgi:hypothetical protein
MVIPQEPDPIIDSIPLMLPRSERGHPLAHARVVHGHDLFSGREFLSAVDLPLSPARNTLVLFTISPSVLVAVDIGAVRPPVIQCLLAGIAAHIQSRRINTDGELKEVVLDEQLGIVLWTIDSAIAGTALDLWKAIHEAGDVQADGPVTPKLYGTKLRMTDLLVGAASAVLPEGAPILDVMAGTGIVTRKFASRFEVSTNDANPYAALLGRAQGAKLDEHVEALLKRIKEAAEPNFNSLRDLVADAFRDEADFLHGDLDEGSLAAYQAFCARPILEPSRPNRPDQPYQLCLTRYANAYFGVAQSAEIDSLRAALDKVISAEGETRDLCLAALLVAASTCNSGPHFAQPRKLSSLRSFQDVVERRARSVMWEFELTLRRFASRRALRYGLRSASQLDWRGALDRFVIDVGQRRPAAVYVDPPYSKLQYSRYYHVLNVILAYDHPEIEGVGRYPSRATRFSSRFEYQARSAEREFEDVFQRCASQGLHLVLSYSDRGFIPIEVLISRMRAWFGDVLVFWDRVRHHSQGVPLGGHQGYVTELVLVGQPSTSAAFGAAGARAAR